MPDIDTDDAADITLLLSAAPPDERLPAAPVALKKMLPPTPETAADGAAMAPVSRAEAPPSPAWRLYF